MRGFGGDLVSADGKSQLIYSSGSIDGIEAMASLVTKHTVVPPIGTDFGGNGFHLGKVGMMFSIPNASVATRKTVGTNFERDVELRPAFWTCTHSPDSHGFGSGRGRRLGGFEGDGAEVAKAPVPTVRVVPRFDIVEDGLEHVGP